ncbi:putative RNA-directed DNA polymerase from transposon X-element [Trichonephila clavipes]|nr:putative RNA-directed DNA polymerase from transposon X-element [Trichonephila clavipes]
MKQELQLFDSSENYSPSIIKLCEALKTIPQISVEGEREFSAAALFRFSAVRFGNAISSFKQSETGLPQGTVISPILFNIFINDLPDLLASDGLTNTALFVDDLAIWSSTPKRDQSKLNTILNLTLERLNPLVY